MYRVTPEENGTAPDIVACPCCRGMTGFAEHHRPTGPHGPLYIFRHVCLFCASYGAVGREVARSFWLRQLPAA